MRNFFPFTAFIAAVALIGWSVLGSSAFQTCVTEAQQHHTPEELQKNFANLLVLLKVAPGCGFDFIDRYHDAIVALGTLIIAFFTFTLWRATDRLWTAGERQLKLLFETSASQSRDMQASIVAAQQSAAAAAQALSANRAWMIWDNIPIHQASEGMMGDINFKIGLMAQPAWKNRGRSPALRTQIVSTSKLGNFSDEIPPQFVPSWALTAEAGAPVGPDQSASGPYCPMVDQDRSAIIERRAAWFIYSAVRYRDIFSPEIERISEICVRVRYNGEATDKDGKKSLYWEIVATGPQNTAT